MFYSDFVRGWSDGQTKTIAEKEWYVISTNSSKTVLFCKSSIGTGNWSTANTNANNWASSNKSSITGTTYDFAVSSHLPTMANIGASYENYVASQYNLGIYYWLSDQYTSSCHYFIATNGGCYLWGPDDSNTDNIVPVLELSP